MPRRHNRAGRSKDRFAMVRHDMVKSPAYRRLSPTARAIWIEILCRYNGQNNGDIPLSCREVGQLVGVSKNTASKAFQELLDKGFVRIGQDSSFTLKTRLSRRWALTHESVGNRPATSDWRAWKHAEKQNTVTPKGHTVSEIGP